MCSVYVVCGVDNVDMGCVRWWIGIMRGMCVRWCVLCVYVSCV